MNRLILKLNQREQITGYLIKFLLLIFTVQFIGCVKGINLYPSTPRIENADNIFEEAESITIISNETDKKQKALEKKHRLYEKAFTLYLEMIDRNPKGKDIQRAHYQVAEIYKRIYEFDRVNIHYQSILKIDPSGYYARESKGSIAGILKNRQLITQELANYQNYKTLYATKATDEAYNIAAESLYKVAQSYESLENYSEAIVSYEKMVEEFPKHHKSVQAQIQIGNIYFYKLYDYTNSGGLGAFELVVNMFPDTYESKQATVKLRKTEEKLTEIKQLQDEIQEYKEKITTKDELLVKKCMIGGDDIIIQNYQKIANNWEEIHNIPNAIETYKILINDFFHKKFAAADALYRLGMLYQQLGQYEKAIKVYEKLLIRMPESVWRNETKIQLNVCYGIIGE